MSNTAKRLFGPRRLISKVVLLCLLTFGCSGGAPLAGVKIIFHAKTSDPSNATLSMAKTDAEGRFKAWTYQADDGVPPGDYTVTFDDQSKTQPHMRSSPDLFNGKYSDPKKSEFKVKVPESGEPIDMGTIELKH